MVTYVSKSKYALAVTNKTRETFIVKWYNTSITSNSVYLVDHDDYSDSIIEAYNNEDFFIVAGDMQLWAAKCAKVAADQFILEQSKKIAKK